MAVAMAALIVGFIVLVRVLATTAEVSRRSIQQSDGQDDERAKMRG
jgi:hypothetical protein